MKHFFSHCAISPLTPAGLQASKFYLEDQATHGMTNFMGYYLESQEAFKNTFAQLLKTAPGNIAAVKNTSEAMSMIANGYRFEPGDEIISFIHEYPANHYPWRILERKGVRLKLIPNRPFNHPDTQDKVGYFTVDDVARLITAKTKVIALSHVQFTSGFALDLAEIVALCQSKGIDLIIDAAQSMGCLPLYPEEYGIAAIAAAGWKWLMGPFGSGVFYTSPSLREKLDPVLIGAETMEQGFDYLNHEWTPHHSAKRFEYSSSSVALSAGLRESVESIHLAQPSMESIRDQVLGLQDHFLKYLNHPDVVPIIHEHPHRSGILSLAVENPKELVQHLAKNEIICTPRNGFVRIAPFVHQNNQQMEQLAEVINQYQGNH
jgi:cysteine desulfurase/selenocysteine lyase